MKNVTIGKSNQNEMALNLAHASSIVYRLVDKKLLHQIYTEKHPLKNVESVIQSELKKYTTFTDVTNVKKKIIGHSTFLVCCEVTYKNVIVPLVIFMGTVEYAQWMVDLKIGWKMGAEFAPNTPKVNMHRGFYNSYKSVKEFVHNYVKRNSYNGQVLVCGHSLGGALACTCSLDLALNGLRPIGFTYGAPRVGDLTFQKAYKEYRVRLFQYQNVNKNTWNKLTGYSYEGDPIPTTPFLSMGYVHVGCVMKIRAGSKWSHCEKYKESKKNINIARAKLPAQVLIPVLSGPTTASFARKGAQAHPMPEYIKILTKMSKDDCQCEDFHNQIHDEL